MDVGVIGEQAFLRSVVEVGSVVDTGNFARGTSEHLWLPCVKMGVEVDHGDGAISTVDGS